MVGRGRKERWADAIFSLKKGDFSFQTGSGLLISSTESAHVINHESSWAQEFHKCQLNPKNYCCLWVSSILVVKSRTLSLPKKERQQCNAKNAEKCIQVLSVKYVEISETHAIYLLVAKIHAGGKLALKLNVSVSPNANVVTSSGAGSLWSSTGSTLCQVLLLQVFAQPVPTNVCLISLRLENENGDKWLCCVRGISCRLWVSFWAHGELFGEDDPKRRFLMCWRYSEIYLFPNISLWCQSSYISF